MPGILYEHGKSPAELVNIQLIEAGWMVVRPPKAKCSSFQTKMQTAWMRE